MNLLPIASLLIIVGSLVFVGATALPPHIYQEPDTEKRLAMVANQRGSFLLSNIIFGLASIVTGLGFGLFAFHLRDTLVAVPAFLGALIYGLAALLLCWFLYVRAKDIAAYFSKTLPGWIMPLYVVSLTLSLIVLGAVLIQMDYPGWLGIGLIALCTVLFAAYLIYKDTIPQVYYLLTLVVGLVVLAQG